MTHEHLQIGFFVLMAVLIGANLFLTGVLHGMRQVRKIYDRPMQQPEIHQVNATLSGEDGNYTLLATCPWTGDPLIVPLPEGYDPAEDIQGAIAMHHLAEALNACNPEAKK